MQNDYNKVDGGKNRDMWSSKHVDKLDNCSLFKQQHGKLISLLKQEYSTSCNLTVVRW